MKLLIRTNYKLKHLKENFSNKKFNKLLSIEIKTIKLFQKVNYIQLMVTKIGYL